MTELMIKRAGIFFIALVCFGCNPKSATKKGNRVEKEPNIILVMADDLGWGDTGYNGHPTIKTPNLDKMAGNGLQFNRYYAAAPVCSPTRGSCLTGRNSYRYGIFTANVSHLKKKETNLAEVFRENGYATGHFGKWHLGALDPEFSTIGKGRKPKENYMTPGMAGFDEWFSTELAVPTYDPYSKENTNPRAWKIDGDWRAVYWHNGQPLNEVLEGCDSEIIMDKAIPFIRKAVKEEKPFLAVIWFHAPHAPVIGHPEYMKSLYADQPELKQHYYSVVTALDAQVGRLRQELRNLKIADNSLIFFSSDNGPEGNPGKKYRYQGETGSLRGRKRSLYEGGIRVPGILEWPTRIESHREVDMPVVSSDYFLTFCELIGYKIDSNHPYDGISLLNIINGKQTIRNQNIGFQFDGHKQRALIGEQYKLLHNTGKERSKSDNGQVPFETYELYDLINDPGETKNVIRDHPEIASQMKKELLEFVNSCAESNMGKDY